MGGGSNSCGGTEPNDTCDDMCSRSIRAESRYLFPDGSVRRNLGTVGGSGPGGAADDDQAREEGSEDISVPMMRVGMSRTASADSSSGPGFNLLGSDLAHDSFNHSDYQHNSRRHIQLDGASGDANSRIGACMRKDSALGSRPPRPYIPFLNLPCSGETTPRQAQSSYGLDGGKSSVLPVVNDSARWRKSPSAGAGRYLVSAGRTMIRGLPQRGSTDISDSPSKASGEEGSEDSDKPYRRRHRRGPYRWRNYSNDVSSQGVDTVRSGSTDVEYLRRRAEAKLRSLERREAAQASAGSRAKQIVSESDSTTRRSSHPM